VIEHSALNKTLAPLLWGKTADGADDVAVYPGVLSRDGSRYYLTLGEAPSHPELLPEWLPRITAVPPDVRETLCDCEYQLSLTVGDIGDDEAEGFTQFGLRWPG
jgi:hypothetical protein